MYNYIVRLENEIHSKPNASFLFSKGINWALKENHLLQVGHSADISLEDHDGNWNRTQFQFTCSTVLSMHFSKKYI